MILSMKVNAFYHNNTDKKTISVPGKGMTAAAEIHSY